MQKVLLAMLFIVLGMIIFFTILGSKYNIYLLFPYYTFVILFSILLSFILSLFFLKVGVLKIVLLFLNIILFVIAFLFLIFLKPKYDFYLSPNKSNVLIVISDYKFDGIFDYEAKPLLNKFFYKNNNSNIISSLSQDYKPKPICIKWKNENTAEIELCDKSGHSNYNNQIIVNFK